MPKLPSLPNLKTFYEAGIDPATGLPLKWGKPEDRRKWKSGMITLMRIKDEQQAVNRYKWTNFPVSLSSSDIERLIYYKGGLLFFYFEELESYYLMPFALSGSIDYYLRFNTVKPVPMSAGAERTSISKGTDKQQLARLEALLSNKRIQVMHQKPSDAKIEITEADKGKVGVILRDYRQQLPQTIIPRATLQEPLLDIISDIVPFLHTALLASTGVTGIRVDSQDAEANIVALANKIYNCALNDQPFAAVVSALELQEITGSNVAKVEEFLQALQSLDNLRLSFYGLNNGGMFQKKAHMLQEEEATNEENNAAVLYDGLELRQRFCEIANETFGLDISVEINEEANNNGVNEYSLERESQMSKTIQYNNPTEGGSE